MKGITKDYPGVRALDDVRFEVKRGEVHALVGENGAGKSTLIKLLSGAVERDKGDILFNGTKIVSSTPQEIQQLGISIIYQEFNLIPNLSVAENIFLGRERKKITSRKWEIQKSAEILSGLGTDLDPRTPVNRLGVAQQQIVEIARALSVNAKLIAMDEPSSALTEREIGKLFELIIKLKSEDVSIIYISHRLDEIFEIADTVTVFRDGKCINTSQIKEISKQQLIQMMVGRKLDEAFPEKKSVAGEEILSLRGVTRKGVIEDISFSLRKGEILGITGLVGAGRTELARAIFGADEIDEGEFYLDGNPVEISSPIDAIKKGISLLTEDRKLYGLILGMSVRENIVLASLRNFSKFFVVKKKQQKDIADKFINELRIKTPSQEQLVRNLSGGNQQKVVLSKWLLANSKVIIFDEPTKGIDVGAKIEIYQLMRNLAEDGVGIIMISSELPEIIGMSDRIIVMNEGRITGELDKQNATQAKIMSYATA